ncbi:hypothetical protein KKG90_05260 [Candidatus Bipolaricaulota bacterium]|nr:hypothetical protein [Candidatus Bipolaricaulota bacterium]
MQFLLLGTVAIVGVVAAAKPDRPQYEGDCVFCWIDGSEADMPVWSSATGGYTHQSRDERQQVVIDQTLSVRRGETRTFSNVIVWIRPTRRSDIEVSGKLVFENCLLLWEQSEHQQTRLRIKDGGTLRVTNSYSFSTNPYWVNWEFESGATVRLNRFVGDPWTSIWGAVDYESVDYSTVKMTFQNDTRGSNVQIRNAHHLWFEIFPPLYRSVDITLAPRQQWADWTIEDMWPNTVVQVVESYIYQRDISLSRGNHVTIRDTVDGLSIGWAIGRNVPGFVECEIVGLGTPGRDEGTYYANRTWNLPAIGSSLTLINSTLERAWPTTWGNVHLVVRDSNLVDPRVWGGPATYEIYDSTMDHAAAYAGGSMYLENCMVRYDLEIKGAGSTIHGYGLRSLDVREPFAVLELDGGQYLELDSAEVPW